MKYLKYVLLALFVMMSQTEVVEAKSKKSKAEKRNVMKVTNYNDPQSNEKFFITQDDVNHDGFVISHPGEWILAEDIEYSTDGQNPAITIAAPDVTLNLNHKVLSLRHGCGDIIGIYVEEDLGNITIKDGTVKYFPRAGIFKDGPQGGKNLSEKLSEKLSNKFSLKIDNCDCPPTNFRLLNVQAICNGRPNVEDNCVDGMGGAVIFGTKDVLIDNSAFLNNAFAGLYVSNSTKVTITDSRFDDNISSFLEGQNTFFTAGAFFNLSQNIAICGASFNSNFSENEAHGLYMLSCKNCVVEKVQAQKTTVSMTTPDHIAANSFGTVSGIEFDFSTNISLKNAQAFETNLFNSVDPTGNNSNYGFRFQTCNAFDMEMCEASCGITRNTNTTDVFNAQTQGLNTFSSVRGHIKNCQFFKQINDFVSPVAESLMQVQGVDINMSQDIELDNCYAAYNTQTAASVQDPSLAPQASGFKVSGGSKRVIMQDCVSLNNEDSGTFGGGFGFSTQDASLQNIQFIRCIAEENRNSDDSSGAGFLLDSIENLEVTNSKAYTNSVGLDIISCNNVLLKFVNAISNVFTGINVNASQNVTITDSSATTNNVGIHIADESTYVTIVDSHASTNTTTGLDLDTCTNVEVSRLKANSNAIGINIANSSKYIEIAHTQANTNSNHGMNLDTCENVVIKDSFANVNTVAGLNLASCLHVEIKNVKASSNATGIDVSDSTKYLEIAHTNASTNSNHGMNLDTCENILIKESVASVNTNTGINLVSCINAEIAHSKASANNIGIHISEDTEETENCMIHNNTAIENAEYGFFDESESETVAYFQNVAKNNGDTPCEHNYYDGGTNTIFPDACTCEDDLNDCVSQDQTPIRLWELPNAPCPLNTNCILDNLDNISIVLD